MWPLRQFCRVRHICKVYLIGYQLVGFWVCGDRLHDAPTATHSALTATHSPPTTCHSLSAAPATACHPQRTYHLPQPTCHSLPAAAHLPSTTAHPPQPACRSAPPTAAHPPPAFLCRLPLSTSCRYLFLWRRHHLMWIFWSQALSGEMWRSIFSG